MHMCVYTHTDIKWNSMASDCCFHEYICSVKLGCLQVQHIDACIHNYVFTMYWFGDKEITESYGIRPLRVLIFLISYSCILLYLWLGLWKLDISAQNTHVQKTVLYLVTVYDDKICSINFICFLLFSGNSYINVMPLWHSCITWKVLAS